VQRRKATSALLPRHREVAIRAIASFLLIAGLVIEFCAAFVPGFTGNSVVGRWATVAVATVMVLGGVACWRVPARIPDAFLTAVPFVAVVVICALDLITRDSSLGAHLYFLWPVLYAAMYLRRAVGYAILGAVFVADAAIVFTLVDTTAQAWADFISMVAALTISTLIIMGLRERADKLVAVLETQALADPLTGLANRRAFTRDIEEGVARVRRTGEPLSLITIDVDHFKSINDAWGHAAGDNALRTLADAIRTVVRRSDVVARLGGDEFVVLLDAGPEGARRVAEALRDVIATADLPGGPPTLSMGLASVPADADDAESLLAASDAALYQAKLAGRNRLAGPRDGTITTAGRRARRAASAAESQQLLRPAAPPST
jgi:diguanylate cyclase (GGDEF)-like protein